MFCWFVLLASVIIVFVNSLSIESITTPVVLQDIPFSLHFDLSYSFADLQQNSTIYVTILYDKSILTQANFSIWKGSTQQQFTFEIESLLVSSLGLQEINLIVDIEQARVIKSHQIWVIWGGATLVPLILTMLVALLTQNVLPALLIGCFTSSFLIYGFDVGTAFGRTLDSVILTAVSNSENQLVILFAMIMGGFVNMINDSGGSTGLANSLSKYAKSSRSAQLVTLFLGCLIFFDDYASALILGGTMSPVTDRMFVSRQKLCFLVDSGAAPIAALVPITSWTAFESALLQVEADKLLEEGIDLTSLGYEISGFLGLIRMLKYAYYSIFLLMFQVISIVSCREFASMFTAERRMLLDGLPQEEVGKNNEETTELKKRSRPPRCRNACIPILFFVFYVIIAMVVLGAAAVPTHEEVAAHTIFAHVDSITVMYYGASLASILCLILYRIQLIPVDPLMSEESTTSPSVKSILCFCCFSRNRRPLMNCHDSLESFVEGFTHLTSTIMILVLAWSIGSAVDMLGAGRFFANSLQSNVSPTALPTLIFFISCLVAFSTGTSWGTMALLFPICGPVAFILSQGNAELYYCSMAAILEGSVFGDHCSFISDTTIMSSVACKCSLTSHVITQLPYAFLVALVSILCGFLPIGTAALSVVGTYFLGFFVLLVFVFLVGAKPKEDKLDYWNMLSIKIQTSLCGKNYENFEIIKLMKRPVVSAERRRTASFGAIPDDMIPKKRVTAQQEEIREGAVIDETSEVTEI